MRLYEVGTASPFGGPFSPYKPLPVLPGGAYPGQKLFNSRKEEFRVCKASSTITVPGDNAILTDAKYTASGANASVQAISAAQLPDVKAGTRELYTSATLVKDKFAGGTIVIKGLTLNVAANDTGVIYLADDLPIDIGSADAATLYTSPFNACGTSGADNNKCAGAALVTVASGLYYLAKTKGPVRLDLAAIAAGNGRLSKAASGKADDSGAEIIGAPLHASGAITAGAHDVFLDIA